MGTLTRAGGEVQAVRTEVPANGQHYAARRASRPPSEQVSEPCVSPRTSEGGLRAASRETLTLN